MKSIKLLMACNDDQGNFSGEFDALQVDTCEILDLTNMTESIQCEIADSKLIVKGSVPVLGIPGDAVRLQILQHQSWVGNCVWDAFTVPGHEAMILLDYLRHQNWTCECSVCLGDYKCSLGDLWYEGTLKLDELIEAIEEN